MTENKDPMFTDARDAKLAIEFTQAVIAAQRGNTTPMSKVRADMVNRGNASRVMLALATLFATEVSNRLGPEGVEADLIAARAVYTAEADQLDAADETENGDRDG